MHDNSWRVRVSQNVALEKFLYDLEISLFAMWNLINKYYPAEK